MGVTIVPFPTAAGSGLNTVHRPECPQKTIALKKKSARIGHHSVVSWTNFMEPA